MWVRMIACGRTSDLSNEVGERHVERVGDEEQVVEECGVRALLDSVDGLTVQPGEFPELLLTQLRVGPCGPHMTPDRLAAGDYPLGQRIGWHALTLVGPVIIVCTNVGTFGSLDSSHAQALDQ